MADWFAWNGVKCTDYGIHVLTHPAISRPKERVTTQVVPGRSGTLTITEGDCVYDEFIASCECIAPNPASIPAFSAWLHGPGVVMFGNRPTGYYHARVNNQIDFETVLRGRPNRKFTVNFRCQPFLYLLNMPDIVLTAPGPVVNLGTVFAEPVITVEGTGDIDLMVGAVPLGITGLVSAITIDVPQQLAYHEGINLTGSLTGDEWPTLPVGTTAVSWTGNVTADYDHPQLEDALMGEVYIYSPDTEDFDTMGLCGSLTPTSCVHTEARNDLSEIRLEHPIDENGRWSFLENDYILKCDVPVRTVPPITPEGILVTAHEVWTIRTGTTKAQRNLYYHATGDKVRKKNLPVGMRIPVIYKGENRYKGIFSGKKKVKRKGKWLWKTYTYYGWIAKSAIQYTLTEDWPNDPAAIETVAPAWIVTDQLFRIYKVELRDDGVTAYARHIFYDLLNNLTSYPAGQTDCVSAVDGILANCLVPTSFSVFTDIGGERVTDGWTRVNPVSALLDPETGAAALWGAELVRDNFDFFLLRDAGLNRGVRIEYAKNLLGVSCEVDASDVVTRIVPVGKDKSGKDLLLAPGSYNVDGTVYTIAADQTWIDSPRASLYPSPHVQALECSASCKETKTVTKTMVRVRMIREALAALANDADLPKVSLKVAFLSLGDTEEYAQYRNLEDVFLYDRVRVKHPGIQLDVLTEVSRVEFDCLNEKFRSIELGSVRQDMRKTAVASWQLPSTISGRKIAMESISAAQLEPESVEEIDLSTNGSVIGVAEQTVGITLTIVASRGGVLTAEVLETVLTARVLRGATDLTASYDASRFSWTRSSPDAYGDSLWNASRRGTKSITVTAADVKRQAVFHCTLEGE